MFNNKPPEKLICVDLLSFIQNRKTKTKTKYCGAQHIQKKFKKENEQ